MFSRPALALLCAIIACCLAAPAAAARPAFGVVSDDVFAGPSDYQERGLAQQRALGITVLRQGFVWGRMEPTPGEFDFALTDRFVLAAARHDIDVMPILIGEPPWATSRPTGNQARAIYPPADMQDFGRFAAAIVRRYGAAGSLWSEHPSVAPRPISIIQIWNEPNTPAYWANAPQARAYATMLTVAAAAIRAADPQVHVLAAGLPPSAGAITPRAYLASLGRLGAFAAVDAVALHPYAGNPAGVIRQLDRARAVIPPDMPVWVTEFGWATGGPLSRGRTVSGKRQAQMIERTLTDLTAGRARWNLHGVIYYAWRDAPIFPGGKDYWGLYTGLLDSAARPKAAAQAFARVALR